MSKKKAQRPKKLTQLPPAASPPEPEAVVVVEFYERCFENAYANSPVRLSVAAERGQNQQRDQRVANDDAVRIGPACHPHVRFDLRPSVESEPWPVEWPDSSPYASHPKASHNTLAAASHASAPNVRQSS